MFTRREFATFALSGLVVRLSGVARAAQAGGGGTGVINGVTLGAQTYSFRQLPRPADGDMVRRHHPGVHRVRAARLRAVVADARAGRPPPPKCRVRSCASWRLETPLDHFTAIRKKFDSAKIAIRAFNYSFNDSFTEPEIDRGFEMARALGAEFITASSTLSAAKRVAPFAEKHKMIVAMHNHSDVKRPERVRDPRKLRRGAQRCRSTSRSISTSATSPRRISTRSPTSASTTRTSRTCTSRIGSAIRGRTWSGATGDTPIKRSAAAAEAEQVADHRLPRVRIQGRGHAGRRSEEGPRIHAGGARLAACVASGWALWALGSSARTTSMRCGGSGSSMSSRWRRAPIARLARRPTRSACPRRTAATRRWPPIPTCTSCTTPRPTTCTFPSSWRRSRTESTSCRTSRSP